jgi:hypothetical protein
MRPILSLFQSKTVKRSSRQSSETSQLGAPEPEDRGMDPEAHTMALTRWTSESCLRNFESMKMSSKAHLVKVSSEELARRRSTSEVSWRSVPSSAAGMASI